MADLSQARSRTLLSWHWVDGQMAVNVLGPIETAEVLDMLERLIAIKREEIAKRGPVRQQPPTAQDPADGR